MFSIYFRAKVLKISESSKILNDFLQILSFAGVFVPLHRISEHPPGCSSFRWGLNLLKLWLLIQDAAPISSLLLSE